MISRDIVLRFFESSNKGDMETCTELLSDDLVWTDIGETRFSGRYEGKATVFENLIGPLFSQLKAGIYSEIETVIAEDDKVVVVSKGRSETQEGVKYDNEYCQIFTVKDSKIVEVVEFCDTALVDKVFGKKEA